MTGRLEANLRLTQKVGIKGKVILDIGCTDGWFCEQALAMGAKKVYAIEPDPAKITGAKNKAPKAIITQGIAETLEFRDRSFDRVFLLDVIEHVSKNSESQVFAEINRVLKKGGKLLISTPFDSLVSKFGDVAWYLGHRHYSREKLQKMLTKAGFKVEFVAIHGGLWEIFGMWNLYISKWIFKRSMILEDWFDIYRKEEFKKSGFVEIFVIAKKVN